MQLIVKDNLRDVLRSMDKIRLDQVPFATAKALTKTAQATKSAIVAEMERVFDRPTRWTLNSLYIKPATKRTLSARVWVKNTAGSGPSPENWTLPEVQGGPRKYKRFEKALQLRGLMPQGMAVVPTKYIELDANGNVNGRQMLQILRYLKSFGNGSVGPVDRRKQGRVNKKQGYAYFAGTPNGGQPMGIWKRVNFSTGSAIVPLFLYVPMPQYKPRLDFFGIGERVYSTQFLQIFRQALTEAMRTAK
ncbi:MAG: hypothetical protein ACR2IJ_00425 [Fluviibacter sp.]